MNSRQAGIIESDDAANPKETIDVEEIYEYMVESMPAIDKREINTHSIRH